MTTTHAPAAEILRLLPQPKPDDAPEVAHALTEAYALWSRGRRSDAVTLLRGAIVRAAETGGSDRANELAQQVTNLVNALHASPSPTTPVKTNAQQKAPPPPPRGRVPAGAKAPAPPTPKRANGVEAPAPAPPAPALAPALAPAPA